MKCGSIVFRICSNHAHDRRLPHRDRRNVNARWPVSRVLSSQRTATDDHSSGTPVARRLARPTRATGRETPLPTANHRPVAPIWSCSRWGLPCRRRYRRRGALLPHPFTLARRRSGWRFAFCGTFPGVAPAGRYPAPCSRGARTFLAPPKRSAAIRPSGPPQVRLLQRPVKPRAVPDDGSGSRFPGRPRRRCGSGGSGAETRSRPVR